MNGRAILRLLVRLAVSAALLTVLLRSLEVEGLGERLMGMDLGWVAVALGLSLVQVVGSAWRWRFTAGRLGLDLPLGSAVAEYYLATFLNQVLPGGVVGDVSRAWRHTRLDQEAEGEADATRPAARWRAVHAVVLERLSGQMAVFAVALVSLVVIGTTSQVEGLALAAGALVVGVLLSLGMGLAARWVRSRSSDWLVSARSALLAPDALRVQVVTSTLVVLSYVAMYLAAAAAVGVDTPVLVLAPLVTPVLLSMLIPVTVAGWGLREGAAAGLWGLVGLSAADGVTISVAYGILVLLSSLPGVLVLLLPGWGFKPRASGQR